MSRAAYEGDIVSRLRNWRGLHLAHVGQLLEEAAQEIERLRNIIAKYTVGISPDTKSKPTLTDEEREAVEAAVKCADLYDEEMDGFASGVSKTLRKLLERLK